MATLKDVAREAGLTVTTVSRVLNNRGYISDNARERVAKAMKKLNYRPNELARSLQNKSFEYHRGDCSSYPASVFCGDDQ